MGEIFYYWWWVFAFCQLVVLAFLKWDKGNFFMSGVLITLLFLLSPSWYVLIVMGIGVSVVAYLLTRAFRLDAIEGGSIGWLLGGIWVQGADLAVIFLGSYVVYGLIMALCHKWIEKDHHTVQLLSLITVFAVSSFLLL